MMFEYALAVFSEYKEKALLVAADLLGTDGKQSGRGVHSIQPLGILARPTDPDQDANGNATNGAGLLFSFDGSEVFGLPMTDPRAVAKTPELKKGGFACGSALCNSEKPALLAFDGESGTVQLLVPNADGSKNHTMVFDSTNNAIQIVSSTGLRIVLDDNAGSVFLQAGAGATIECKTDGTGTLNGNWTVNGSMQYGPASQKVALVTDLDAIKAQIAALQSAPGTAGGPLVGNVPATTPGSSALSA